MQELNDLICCTKHQVSEISGQLCPRYGAQYKNFLSSINQGFKFNDMSKHNFVQDNGFKPAFNTHCYTAKMQ